MTSASIGLLRHVGDPLRQKRLIAKPGLLAKVCLGPSQNGFEIPFGGRGDQKPAHYVTYHSSDV